MDSPLRLRFRMPPSASICHLPLLCLLALSSSSSLAVSDAQAVGPLVSLVASVDPFTSFTCTLLVIYY